MYDSNIYDFTRKSDRYRRKTWTTLFNKLAVQDLFLQFM